MRYIWQAALLIAICITAQVEAQDVRRLYTPAELEGVGSRYRPNLERLWKEDLLSRLTREERLRAGTVRLSLPLMGTNRHPLDFYADPARQQVFVPIASVKFVDDMAVAFAYYEKMGCDQGTVSDYAAALRFRPQEAKGSPLDALGVPAAAINDPFVDDVAQKILKSTVFFVAAHEYAHVMYGHKGYRAIRAAEAQRQEAEADAFALDVLRRIGVAPLGVVYFFLTASRLEASPGDFSTPDEYETYLGRRATHPVSAQRILKVADAIEGNIVAFSRLQSNPAAAERKLRELVPQLKQIGRTLDDRATRRGLGERAQATDMAAFRLRCRR